MAEVIVVGSFVQDLAFETASFPSPGESRIGTFRTGPGGKGFNQAIACNRQGVDTLFVGAVGDDIFGEEVRQFASSEGLVTDFQICPGELSGAASIVVNSSAENMIVVSLGANENLSEKHVESLREQFVGAKVFVSQLESNTEATLAGLRLAKENGLITILNPAPISKELSEAILLNVDILTPNETEFSFLFHHLYGKTLPEEYWLLPDEQLLSLTRQIVVPTTIVTLGKYGCVILSDNCVNRVPAFEVSAVDTTGAGDAFTGGLAAGLKYFPDNIESAVNYATITAGLSTTNQGTAPAMPYKQEVENALHQSN